MGRIRKVSNNRRLGIGRPDPGYGGGEIHSVGKDKRIRNRLDSVRPTTVKIGVAKNTYIPLTRKHAKQLLWPLMQIVPIDGGWINYDRDHLRSPPITIFRTRCLRSVDIVWDFSYNEIAQARCESYPKGAVVNVGNMCRGDCRLIEYRYRRLEYARGAFLSSPMQASFEQPESCVQGHGTH